jgi:CDP-glucose 4,6-dehydratase
MTSLRGDVRDLGRLCETFATHRPEIVFHLAAQPLVRVGYCNPVDTYAINVMGTVNVLEAARRTSRSGKRNKRQVLRESGVVLGLS